MSTSNIDSAPKYELKLPTGGIFGDDELQITGPHKDGGFVFVMTAGLEIHAVSMTKKQLRELAAMCRRAIK